MVIVSIASPFPTQKHKGLGTWAGGGDRDLKMNAVFLYKYSNSRELPEKFSRLPYREWAAERPKATHSLTIHWLLLSQPQEGRWGHYLTCPPDGFKHKKTKSNSLKDCIHHWLPITETKLISQDDASGTTTQLSTMEPQALWNVLSQQRALWIYRSRSAAFQSLFGKAFPSLPDQQTLWSNLNLLYSSHLNC